MACAVEPLAARVCLPPQSTLAPAVYGRLAGESLHADTNMALAARTLTARIERVHFTLRRLPLLAEQANKRRMNWYANLRLIESSHGWVGLV